MKNVLHRRRGEAPPDWPASTGRPRVLIENPDHAVLWSYAPALREAGYEVAACTGPAEDDAASVRCPLLEGVPCPLVEGADVVLSTCSLARSREILAALSDSGHPVVFEVPQPAAESYRDVAPRAELLPVPVTEAGLLETVARVLAETRATAA